jgi:F-type H+-transporting ATPase subunit delta
MSSVAKRYTPALLDVAREAGELDAVQADVQALTSLLEASPEFLGFIRDPLLPAEKRSAVLEALFAKSGAPVMVTFLKLLARQDRLADLPEILAEVSASLDAEKNVLEVSLKTAAKFTKAQISTLTEKLEARWGKTVRLTEEVDESLIGGFLIRTGDLIEDHSLLAKLNRFKQNIINA